MFERNDLNYLEEALRILDQGFRDLPELNMQVQSPRARAVLNETANRLQDNFPYPHPLYAGQMLKPPHPVARLAYMLARCSTRSITSAPSGFRSRLHTTSR